MSKHISRLFDRLLSLFKFLVERRRGPFGCLLGVLQLLLVMFIERDLLVFEILAAFLFAGRTAAESS
ncbi:MAG: hypothetical protein EBS83_07820 [Planctomycetia bacterium]|nr:hypothetical protein [Planctomycetia bacterium]